MNTEVQRLTVTIKVNYTEVFYKMQDFHTILKEFSDTRLLTYKNFLRFELSIENYTSEQVYNLYAWNEAISSVFWVMVSRIEIILRNHINHILVEKIGENWLDVSESQNNRIFFTSNQEQQIKKANRKLEDIGKNITNDRLVAELTMGFWLSFHEIGFSFSSSETKEKQIDWRYFIPTILTDFSYPNQNTDKVRYWSNKKNVANLISRLNIAKEIRNRIAHHEPVFNYTPTHLQDIATKDRWGFLQNLNAVYQNLLIILHDLSSIQSTLYQRNYNHTYTQYLLSQSGFDEHLKLSNTSDIVDLERFIGEMMECMGNDKLDTSLGIRHISNNYSYFGCFIPLRIKE